MDTLQIAYRLRTLFEQKVTQEYYDSFKGRFGRVQVEVLSDLYENKTVRIQELAGRLNIPKQHASKIISRLEEQELILSSPDPGDGRSVLYALNETGRALVEQHLLLSNRRFLERLNKLSPSERQVMMEAMGTVARLLEKM